LNIKYKVIFVDVNVTIPIDSITFDV